MKVLTDVYVQQTRSLSNQRLPLLCAALMAPGLRESVEGWEEEGNLDLQARLDGMDTRVHLAWTENQDQPAPREKRVTKETLGHGVTRARLDLLVLPVPQVLLVPEGPLETQARMGPVVLLESRVFQAVMALREHRDHLGSR
ncbi:Hypothetical protein SMAX5B_008914 [Scophthalmus maximus]|uniref:Uncharacterized protein n=1 Tax=Scophthalmus maximus TaxID=52904 RepID=A0A2U9C6K7_SCOMX|nr:Hypothetical protein SMAX5B_008914 [Scophthalmus maximus]